MLLRAGLELSRSLSYGFSAGWRIQGKRLGQARLPAVQTPLTDYERLRDSPAPSPAATLISVNYLSSFRSYSRYPRKSYSSARVCIESSTPAWVPSILMARNTLRAAAFMALKADSG